MHDLKPGDPGVPPNVMGVSEEKIQNIISEYRLQHPRDDRSYEELRPFAIRWALWQRAKITI